ncbi:magnesium transporter, partial [Pseudoalteromonas sp. S185]
TISTEQLSLVCAAIPKEQRREIWQLLDEDTQHEIFVNLSPDRCLWLLQTLDASEAFKLLDEVNVEELLELEAVIPERIVDYTKKQ